MIGWNFVVNVADRIAQRQLWRLANRSSRVPCAVFSTHLALTMQFVRECGHKGNCRYKLQSTN